MPELLVGSTALDFELSSETSEIIRRGDFARRWSRLVFHRRWKWLPFREHLLQLQQRKAEIDLLELRVVVVTFETPQYAKAYVAQHSPGYMAQRLPSGAGRRATRDYPTDYSTGCPMTPSFDGQSLVLCEIPSFL